MLNRQQQAATICTQNSDNDSCKNNDRNANRHSLCCRFSLPGGARRAAAPSALQIYEQQQRHVLKGSAGKNKVGHSYHDKQQGKQ